MKNININLHKVILGQLLADGYVEKTGKNSRLSFSFGQHSKDYADWVYSLFSDYCSNSVYSVQSKAKGQVYTNYRLKTKTLPIFNEYRDIFYDSLGKKIVPSQIIEEINSVILAHLIIGDGHFSKADGRTRIYTNHFSFEECNMLAEAITKNCFILCQVLYDRISKTGQKQFVLTIGKSQQAILHAQIIPYIHTSIIYKLGKV